MEPAGGTQECFWMMARRNHYGGGEVWRGRQGTCTIFSLEATRTMALVVTTAVQPVYFQHLDIVVLRFVFVWFLRQDLVYPRLSLSLLCS